MFQNIGISEFVLIAVVALVLFGPDKMPEIGRKVGKAVREFRAGAMSLIEEVTRDPDSRPAKQSAVPAQQESGAAAPDAPVPPAATAAVAPPSGPAEAPSGSAFEVGTPEHRPRAEKPRRPADPRRLPE